MLAYPGLLCRSRGPWGAAFSSSAACPSPSLLPSLLCQEVKQQQTFSRDVKNIFLSLNSHGVSCPDPQEPTAGSKAPGEVLCRRSSCGSGTREPPALLLGVIRVEKGETRWPVAAWEPAAFGRRVQHGNDGRKTIPCPRVLQAKPAVPTFSGH